MRPKHRYIVLPVIAFVVLAFAGWRSAEAGREGRYHSSAALAIYRAGGSTDLPVLYSAFFATSGRCAGCHGGDSLGIASVDSTGRDVNVSNDWRSTLMANSARDPFFRAKLEHEVLVNPGHQTAIENKCLSCHAPMGMHEERMLGHPPFTAAMLDTSTIGLDGVSCLACHMQDPDTAGTRFSGDLVFTPDSVWGPYEDDVINSDIMEFFVGFRPGYAEHIIDGRVCAGCHTLITETIDLQGNLTGDEFVEQATWHEWKNSIYAGTEQNCRGCHIPRLQDSIVLASEYVFLPGHSPFGLHHLVGGNAYMVQMLKDNAAALGVKATDVQFDSTIVRSLAILQRSVEVDLVETGRDADTARFQVRLLNQAGHKFPSGYPSRRAIVEFSLLDDQGDTLFVSGRVNEAYEVEGHDPDLEPHHQLITDPAQAQIYELVMGDVNGNVTTVLERAKDPLKDNRLVPAGFSTTHYTYDTTRIAGAAETDPDFNHDAFGVEGDGGDIVHYHVPLSGYAGALQARVRVLFQPVPPRWNQEMFDSTGVRIDAFRNMVDAADGTPDLVAQDSLFSGPVGLAGHGPRPVRVFPNPSRDGSVFVQLPEGQVPDGVQGFDASGRTVPLRVERLGDRLRVTLPDESGTYLLVVERHGQRWLERVVRW